MITTLLAIKAFAVPGLTTYQAKIIKPDGTALESNGVNFRFTILNPIGSCILYVEEYSAVNMSDSGGVISFSLGTGTKVFPTSGTPTFADVFNNVTASMDCQAGGTFTPASSDVRKIVMQFNDSNGWQTLPAMNINAVPYAMFATRADTATLFNNKADTAFVQYSTIPTCTASQAMRYNGAGFVCVNVASGGGASGTVTAGDITTALGYTPVDPATLSTSYTTTTSFSTVTATVSSLGSSVTAVTTTLNNLSTSVTALASAVAAMSPQWSTSGTTINYTNGNVGVGTVNPNSTFEVSGTTRLNGKLVLGNDPPTAGLFDFGSIAGGAVPYDARSMQQNTITNFSPTAYVMGETNTVKIAPANDASGNLIFGNLNYLYSDAANSQAIGSLYGTLAVTKHRSSGNLLQSLGIAAFTLNAGPRNVTTNVAGQFMAANMSSGSVTSNIGVRILTANGNIGTNIGLMVDNQAIGTASSTYNIFSAGIRKISII